MERDQTTGEPVAEYEREPVPERACLGIKSFLGQYAGEHIAGTELMIGPLFVVHGVGAKDIILGLIVGNLLAVLSWTFMTARLLRGFVLRSITNWKKFVVALCNNL
jgi:hypothetical protein